MSRRPWTDEENDLIVADYFAMLADERAGRPYVKAMHRRALLPQLNDRSEQSIEFKYRNISAVLKGYAELRGIPEFWIEGYRPAVRYQSSLIQAVQRWIGRNPAWLQQMAEPKAEYRLPEGAEIRVEPPPTLSNRPPPESPGMLAISRVFDVAGQEQRNRNLGRYGEELVLNHERASLRSAGRDDLASGVRWVSELDGDGAGYDIASFAPDGGRRLLEVKTTKSRWARTPFFITRNERKVAEARPSEWCLFRLWNLSEEPRAFELRPPLDAHVSLVATAYQAHFR